MEFSNHNRALIRGLLAGVLVLAGVSACSRDKGAETGAVGDTSAVISPETPAADAPGTAAPDRSARAAETEAGDSVTVAGDSSSVDKPGPRAKKDTISAKADSLAEHHGGEGSRPTQ
jgi:hypothetical protein